MRPTPALAASTASVQVSACRNTAKPPALAPAITTSVDRSSPLQSSASSFFSCSRRQAPQAHNRHQKARFIPQKACESPPSQAIYKVGQGTASHMKKVYILRGPCSNHHMRFIYKKDNGLGYLCEHNGICRETEIKYW